MRFEEAIAIMDSMQNHPAYAQAYRLIRQYAVNYNVLTNINKGAKTTTPNPQEPTFGGFIEYKRDKE